MSQELDLLDPIRPKTAADFTEMALNFRASKLVEAFNGQMPSRSELTDITKNLGVEIATALIHRALLVAKPHGAFIEQTLAMNYDERSGSKKWSARNNDEAAQLQVTEVLFIASNLFQSGRQWGDHVEEWRGWARELGFTTEWIDTQAGASVASNARWIREYLRLNPHPRRFIVSYGQGSTELHYLMQRQGNVQADESYFAGWIGWVNVCGALTGAASSDFLRASALRRWQTKLAMLRDGRSPLALEETSTAFGSWKNDFSLPAGLTVANVVALPYSSQVPRGMHLAYSTLAKVGPNDGAVLFSDSLVPGGFTIPIMGMSQRAESVKLKPILSRVLMNLHQAKSPRVTHSPSRSTGLSLELQL